MSQAPTTDGAGTATGAAAPHQQAPLPPRPDCIATFLTTDDFLPGAQTLLYSIKENLSPVGEGEYEPEIVVLVTPTVSESTRSALHPALCTRILEVEPTPFPRANTNTDKSHVSTWDANCGLTKLHVFRLEQYGTVLYVDADCLAVGDVRHLLRLGQKRRDGGSTGKGSSSALIAAAPDLFPPDKFNAGVLLLRPSIATFTDMLARSRPEAENYIESYDGGDTGFLNGYFRDWFGGLGKDNRSTEPSMRLPFGCNAQRFMHNCTYGKRPQYWDVGIGEDLTIVHYSSSPKPWESAKKRKTSKGGDVGADENGAASEAAKAHLDENDARAISDAASVGVNSELDVMWHDWYGRSERYLAKYRRGELKKAKLEATAMSRAEEKKKRLADESAETTRRMVQEQQQRQQQQQPDVHKLVSKRYKELRKSGMSSKDAMSTARAEYGADRDGGADAGQQVMQMFGMG